MPGEDLREHSREVFPTTQKRFTYKALQADRMRVAFRQRGLLEDVWAEV